MSDADPTDGAGPGYEVSDARVAPLLRWGAILLAVTAGSFALVVFLVSFLTGVAERGEQEPPPMMQTGIQIPPEPRLQWRPNDDLRSLHAQEDGELRSYGWIDQEAGIVRIPIERAIDLLVERGLPSREATQ